MQEPCLANYLSADVPPLCQVLRQGSFYQFLLLTCVCRQERLSVCLRVVYKSLVQTQEGEVGSSLETAGWENSGDRWSHVYTTWLHLSTLSHLLLCSVEQWFSIWESRPLWGVERPFHRSHTSDSLTVRYLHYES